MWEKCKRLNPNQIEELKSLINNSQSSGKEVRRAQAILLLDQQKDVMVIGSITRYSRRHIFDLRKKYQEKGLEAVKDRQIKKAKELLTKKHKAEVAFILNNKTPRDFDYNSDYWTATILGDFIKRQYNVLYKSKTSYYLIFKQAKFTYHKPGRVYEKRNEQEVEQWQEFTKPVVEKAFKEPKTVILTEDEMSLSSQTTIQKIWLPQGQYPRIEVSSRKESRSIYGFLNFKTKQEHAFKTKWQNMYITCEVLKELRKIYPLEKILLIWDQGPWHRGSKVQEFIKEDHNIQTIYFPRGAPEENPQEHIWKNGRSQVTHNKFIKDIDKITDDLVAYLNNTEFDYSLLGISAKM